MLRVDLHLHSHYSHDGRSTLPELIERAHECRLDRIALTDHNSVEGALNLVRLAPELAIAGEEAKTIEGEAQAIQWSLWAMTEVEKPALAALLHRFLLPEDRRDPKLADEGEQQLQKPLAVLDRALDHELSRPSGTLCLGRGRLMVDR